MDWRGQNYNTGYDDTLQSHIKTVRNCALERVVVDSFVSVRKDCDEQSNTHLLLHSLQNFPFTSLLRPPTPHPALYQNTWPFILRRLVPACLYPCTVSCSSNLSFPPPVFNVEPEITLLREHVQTVAAASYAGKRSRRTLHG